SVESLSHLAPLQSRRARRALPSFPTRRSSDLHNLRERRTGTAKEVRGSPRYRDREQGPEKALRIPHISPAEPDENARRDEHQEPADVGDEGRGRHWCTRRVG